MHPHVHAYGSNFTHLHKEHGKAYVYVQWQVGQSVWQQDQTERSGRRLRVFSPKEDVNNMYSLQNVLCIVHDAQLTTGRSRQIFQGDRLH